MQVTLAIPMFLGLLQLPPTDPTHRILVSTLQRQVDALLPLQDQATGLWRTLLDDETSYVETSGTSGFVGGILMAIRLVSPGHPSRAFMEAHFVRVTCLVNDTSNRLSTG